MGQLSFSLQVVYENAEGGGGSLSVAFKFQAIVSAVPEVFLAF